MKSDRPLTGNPAVDNLPPEQWHRHGNALVIFTQIDEQIPGGQSAMPSVQLALIDRLSTHHDPLPSLKASRKRNHDSAIITRTFSTASTRTGRAATRDPGPLGGMSGFGTTETRQPRRVMSAVRDSADSTRTSRALWAVS